MTDELKKHLTDEWGMTPQQIESKGVKTFILACANEKGLLEKAMAEEVEALKREHTEMEKKLEEGAKMLFEDMPWIEGQIARLKNEEKEAEERIAKLKQQLLEESIDDRRTRIFLNMVCWFKDNGFSEQEIKSFCNIGKGFFGGWIDPPEEIGGDDNRWTKGVKNQDKTRWRKIS